jgi:hypothetical protein
MVHHRIFTESKKCGERSVERAQVGLTGKDGQKIAASQQPFQHDIDHDAGLANGVADDFAQQGHAR